MVEKNNKISIDFNKDGKVIAAFVVAIFALIISIFGVVSQKRTRKYDDISYKIYVGLTDNDANYQTISTDAAKEIIKTIIIGKSLGYTIYETDGGYKDSEGFIHTEKNIVLELEQVDEKKVYEVMNDIIKRLNVGKLMYRKEMSDVVEYSNRVK